MRLDLTNRRFGRIVALEPTDKRKNGCIIWKCKCDCGNFCEVIGSDLTRNRVQSCGCLKKEVGIKIRKDIRGKRFGKLIAMYPIYNNENKHSKWHCVCDCGNEKDIDLASLTTGKTKSCGCLISQEEENILKLLKEYNINFKYQYRFSNLTNRVFDFYIENKYVIEYDGRQHFDYKNAGWNSENNFKLTRQRDLEKNQYCFKNNIPLIRIPYNKKYSFKDLQLETTNFLLTQDNEQNYYKGVD